MNSRRRRRPRCSITPRHRAHLLFHCVTVSYTTRRLMEGLPRKMRGDRMKVEKGSEQRCRKCPQPNPSEVLRRHQPLITRNCGNENSISSTGAQITTSLMKRSSCSSLAGLGGRSEMIQGWREWRGDAIRQTSFGIVPEGESFMGMGMVWSRSSLHASMSWSKLSVQVVWQQVSPKSPIKLRGVFLSMLYSVAVFHHFKERRT